MKMTFKAAIEPLRRFMVQNQMDPNQLQISMTPEDFSRLMLLFQRDMRFSGEIYGRPITVMGVKIGANYDNRLPIRTVGGDD